MRHRIIAPVLVAILLLATTASADVIWGSIQNSAPTPSTSEHAVLLATGASGTLLTGTVYGLPGSLGVQFSTDNTSSTGVDHLYAFSPTELRSNPPNDPDTSLDQITITLVSGKYGDVYFNLFGMFPETDSASFVVTTSAGTFTHVYTGLTGNDSNNYIFLNATPGDSIISVSVVSRFFALEDTHVSDTTSPLTTPEPGTLLLAGTGLGWLLRRRKITPRTSLHRNRRKLFTLTLLACAMATSLTARADSVTTYNITINWWDTGSFPSTTTGSFTLKITNSPTSAQLTSWSINTPEAGVFDTANSSPAMILPIMCGANPCFEFQFKQNTNPLRPVLMITFAGSVFNFNGGPIVLAGVGGLSRVMCEDPCLYYISGGNTLAFIPPSTPEPSSVILLATGAVGAAFRLWRRAFQRLR